MAQAKAGDTVKVHYHGTFEDGTVFDSTREKDPFQFKLGENQVVRGFEQGILGMTPGEKKSFSVTPVEAFGERREDLVVVMDLALITDHVAKPQVGMMLTRRAPLFSSARREIGPQTPTRESTCAVALSDSILMLFGRVSMCARQCLRDGW